MIHEAMILEYSARHLALIEWAAEPEALRLLVHRPRAVLPVGHRRGAGDCSSCCWRCRCCVVKLAVGGVALALLETRQRKMRIFRAPEFLGTAFLLAVLGMLVHLLLASVSEPAARSRQLINLLAALLLLLAFAMLSQRRILSLIHLFALQGVALVALDRGRRLRRRSQPHLYCLGGAHARAQGGRCCRGSCTG